MMYTLLATCFSIMRKGTPALSWRRTSSLSLGRQALPFVLHAVA